MRILGKIKHISDARVWMGGNGPVIIYTIIFEAGDNTFVGDMFKSQEQLRRRGITIGAIGEMDINFKIKINTKSTGDTYAVQQVRFADFYLANAGVFADNADAAAQAPQNAPQNAAPASAPQQGDEPF